MEPYASYRVIHQFRQLLGLAPAMRVKNHGKDALLEDHGIQPSLPIRQQRRAIWPVNVLRFPVTGNNAREFPADAVDHVRIGIIFDIGRERTEAQPRNFIGLSRKIFTEL